MDYARQRKNSADVLEAFGALLLSIEANSCHKAEDLLVPRSLSSNEDDKQNREREDNGILDSLR
jgi:hypothetical protein